MRSYLFEIDVDPLDTTRLTQKQRWQLFIPIDQVPDDSPNPFEALVMKEDSMLKLGDRNGWHAGTNGHVYSTSLDRPESFDREQFDGSNGVLPFSFADLQIFPVFDEACALIEQALSRKQPSVGKCRARRWQSHGRRGRKPAYKDKIFPVMRY